MNKKTKKMLNILKISLIAISLNATTIKDAANILDHSSIYDSEALKLPKTNGAFSQTRFDKIGKEGKNTKYQTQIGISKRLKEKIFSGFYVEAMGADIYLNGNGGNKLQNEGEGGGDGGAGGGDGAGSGAKPKFCETAHPGSIVFRPGIPMWSPKNKKECAAEGGNWEEGHLENVCKCPGGDIPDDPHSGGLIPPPDISSGLFAGDEAQAKQRHLATNLELRSRGYGVGAYLGYEFDENGFMIANAFVGRYSQKSNTHQANSFSILSLSVGGLKNILQTDFKNTNLGKFSLDASMLFKAEYVGGREFKSDVDKIYLKNYLRLSLQPGANLSYKLNNIAFSCDLRGVFNVNKNALAEYKSNDVLNFRVDKNNRLITDFGINIENKSVSYGVGYSKSFCGDVDEYSFKFNILKRF